MAKEKIEVMVDGGKATAAPPLGPALGPMGVNIGNVIIAINKKTEAFKGMKVPVKVIVNNDTKEFEIEVGTPPVSQLISKEINAEKGSGEPQINIIGNIGIEQAVKIAKMKKDSMLVNNLKAAVKNVVGSCNAMGVMVEGKRGKDTAKDIDKGIYDKIIEEEITEVPAAKVQQLKSQLEVVQDAYKKEQARKQAEEEAKKAAIGAAAAAAPTKEEAAAEGEEKKAAPAAAKAEEKKAPSAAKAEEKKGWAKK